jgi:uncharacterized protein YgbK (DUF1537 family)
MRQVLDEPPLATAGASFALGKEVLMLRAAALEKRVRKAELLSSLPLEWGEKGLLRKIQDRIKVSGRKVVVLDDDPTGTQTVNNVLVLTEWSMEALQHALARDETVFYILTNSRSYPIEQAVAMNREIAENLATAAQKLNQDLDVVSRSDSTLRGHYPREVQALRSTLENRLGITYDGEIIAPFFFEGGRFTAHDIHWVQEGDWLIPAAQTEYAQDPIFGYHHSNLCEWVQEKTSGQVTADSVASVTLDLIRAEGPSGVAAILGAVTGGQSVIVNAVTYRDMEVFLLGLLEAEEEGRRFLFRTAASFVKVRGGIQDRGLLTSRELFPRGAPTDVGGLIIVGSHVQKTTDQLQLACKLDKLASIELSVPSILNSRTCQTEIGSVSAQAERGLLAGHDVIVFTSRRLVTGTSGEENVQIGRQVSDALVQVVGELGVKPRFVVAKGGITSSDIGTKALNVTRAMVPGQILPGIPVWLLGEDSRFPGIPFVIFPGNVGTPDSLAQVITILRRNH